MNIIFHLPLPLDSHSTSASGMRPNMMLQAFQDCGCHVDIVAGYGAERKKRIAEIKQRLQEGIRYEFLYSESSTMPTLLTQPDHLPWYPHLDFGFFSYLKRRGTRIGLFYRDVYWRFQDYQQSVGIVKANFAKFFYRYDLRKYDQLVDYLYLPSLEMGGAVPIVDARKLKALPPGHDFQHLTDHSKSTALSDSIRLLYVGGVGPHYRMHELFQGISLMDNVKLTICTRSSDWDAVKSQYAQYLSDKISIVHLSGNQLTELYQTTDLNVLMVEPQEYREFAVPFKLFEYLGTGQPIIATTGTLAGKFVSENGIGWAIPYSAEALQELLSRLKRNPQMVADCRRQCLLVAPHHTWRARAGQVIRDLGKNPAAFASSDIASFCAENC